jgi:hypothetical protein
MGRLSLPIHRSAAVEVTVRLDCVELRFEERCVAVIGRDPLRAWLISPARDRYPIDDVTWAGTDGGHVRLTIRCAGTWTLHPGTVRQLLAQL